MKKIEITFKNAYDLQMQIAGSLDNNNIGKLYNELENTAKAKYGDERWSFIHILAKVNSELITDQIPQIEQLRCDIYTITFMLVVRLLGDDDERSQEDIASVERFVRSIVKLDDIHCIITDNEAKDDIKIQVGFIQVNDEPISKQRLRYKFLLHALNVIIQGYDSDIKKYGIDNVRQMRDAYIEMGDRNGWDDEFDPIAEAKKILGAE